MRLSSSFPLHIFLSFSHFPFLINLSLYTPQYSRQGKDVLARKQREEIKSEKDKIDGKI